MRRLLPHLALFLLPTSCDDAGPQRPASSYLVEPQVIDFGRYSSCDPPGPLPVRIANLGDEPLAVGDWEASCTCVVANFSGVNRIEPGEHLDVAVTLDPWGMPGPHGHDLKLLVGAPPEAIELRVRYQMDPEVVVRDTSRRRSSGPEEPVELSAVDGQPFRVLSIDPPIPIETGEAAATVATVAIPWSLLDAVAAGEAAEGLSDAVAEDLRGRMRRREDGTWRSLWLRVTTDHPVCGEVSFSIINDAPPEPVSGG